MTNMFISKEFNGMVFYMVPSFVDTDLVIHAFSGRKGGFSQGKYDSLNLSAFSRDNIETVLDNRRKFCQGLGIDLASIVCAEQVHGDHVYEVTLADKGRGAYARDTAIPAVDALITKERGIALFACFADCVPVFFLDPEQQVIALAHAGWRGTVAKIAAKTAQILSQKYGTKYQNLLVGIGPSIGPCHYQVDEPVIARVKEAFPHWGINILSKREKGFANLDLWEANRRQLLDLGVPTANITISGLCTYCHQDKFFSHRAGMLGRQVGVIMLK